MSVLPLLLFYNVSNFFTIFWKLEIYLIKFLIYFKLFAKIVFCSEISGLIAGINSKNSFLAKYFLIVPFSYIFVYNRHFLTIFINMTSIKIHLITIFTCFLLFTSKLINPYSFPLNFIRYSLIETFQNLMQPVSSIRSRMFFRLHKISNNFDIMKHCLLFGKIQLFFKITCLFG